MNVCRYARCKTTIGEEFVFCPVHRETGYAFEYRKVNGYNQP